MSKLLEKIMKQEEGQDREEVLKIYNALKSINGMVWSDQWNVLVKTSFIGKYPNSKEYYSPSKVYEALKAIKG